MAREKPEVAKANAADLAADMTHHRATYARFVRITLYAAIAAGAVLMILFVILRDRGTFTVIDGS